MPWCSHCSGDRPISADEQLINSPDGTRKRRRRRLFASCSACGRVLKDRSLRSLDKALAVIQDIATNALNLNLIPTTAADGSTSDDSAIISDAQDLLRRAMEKEELFGRGRRTRTHVSAACLYVSLLRHHKPYMLIDLSDYLKVTVYVLGAVFVALCRILRIKEDDFEAAAPPPPCLVIDPSLFMHRISTRLLGRKDAEVASTALRILSRTNHKQRGWMLRRQKQIPVRICSAALYIAAIACAEDDRQGHKFSKSEVATTVRNVFESMESGHGLTMDEFVSRAADMTSTDDEEGRELVCQHKKSSPPHSHCRHGLCTECYHVFVKIAGGSLELHSPGSPPSHHTAKRRNKISCEQQLATTSESLSDVEGCDINVYLNTEREKQYKTMIWELMNKEYLEEKSNGAAATGNKPRKERKRTRVVGVGNRGSEEMLPNKSLSSRINYEVLTQLNGDEKQQQHEIETASVGVSNEQNNEDNFDVEALESDNEADTDGDGKSAAAQGDDYYGDFEEDYGEGGCNEYYDEFADDDDEFGF